jgi:hypothetical protein
MLGYKSREGGKNYEFDALDKQQIVEWISLHLLVAWSEQQISGSHATEEKQLISKWIPLLNLQNNPVKFSELQKLRAAYRAGQP